MEYKWCKNNKVKLLENYFKFFSSTKLNINKIIIGKKISLKQPAIENNIAVFLKSLNL